MQQHIQAGTLNIPPSCLLPQTEIDVPLHTVTDDAFPLCNVIMKPYSHRNMTHDQQIFNYRLSRARRLVENVFGILSSRFCVFLSEIPFLPDDAENIVQACVILHNMLNKKNITHYVQPGLIDEEDGVYNLVAGEWRNQNNLTELNRNYARIYKKNVKKIVITSANISVRKKALYLGKKNKWQEIDDYGNTSLFFLVNFVLVKFFFSQFYHIKQKITTDNYTC